MKDNVRVILFAAILGLVCSILLVGATLFTAPYRLANEKAEEIRNFLSALEVPIDPESDAQALLAVFNRDVKVRELGAVARESTVLVGGILIILGMTMAVTNYIVTEEVPQQLFEQIREHMTSKLAFLISLNLFLLLVGCMIDIFAAIALMVPLMIPIAAEYGVHPVHLGIIFLTNMAIGYATPPVGMNLFIASVRLKRPVLKLYWAAIPFILVLLVALGIITYFPWLSLVLLGE